VIDEEPERLPGTENRLGRYTSSTGLTLRAFARLTVNANDLRNRRVTLHGKDWSGQLFDWPALVNPIKDAYRTWSSTPPRNPICCVFPPYSPAIDL